MLAQFKLEWALFTRNTKNRILFILFLAATIYFGLVVAPEFTPLVSFDDTETIEERIEEQNYLIDTYQNERPLTVESANRIVGLSQDQLEALENEDWEEYINSLINVDRQVRIAQYGLDEVDPRFFDVNEDYPSEAEFFWMSFISNRLTSYVSNDNINITPSVIEERTVLQTIQRLFMENLPYILLIVLVLFSVDSLTKNKGHQTLFNSAPLSFGSVLWVKSLVILFGFVVTLLVSALLLVISLGPRYGIGSFSIPTPVYSFDLYGGTFGSISLGLWFTQALILLILLSLILIRGILLFSVLIKQEFFNLIIGTSVLFTEGLYYTRGIGHFSDIGLLPPTFVSIGSVLMGQHNFLYNSSDIHFLNGVLSLGAAWIGVEILLFIVTRFRRFRRI